MSPALPVALPAPPADRLEALFDAHHAPAAVSWGRTVMIAAAIGFALVAALVISFSMWSQPVQAAVRFEVRLAETSPGDGLRQATILGSDQVIYLHEQVIVTNSDIERAGLKPGSSPSQFGIDVEFNTDGARKMRAATENHIGRPVAILIDGEVVLAPVLRSPIDASAFVSGSYTRAEAERIVNGIMVR